MKWYDKPVSDADVIAGFAISALAVVAGVALFFFLV